MHPLALSQWRMNSIDLQEGTISMDCLSRNSLSCNTFIIGKCCFNHFNLLFYLICFFLTLGTKTKRIERDDRSLKMHNCITFLSSTHLALPSLHTRLWTSFNQKCTWVDRKPVLSESVHVKWKSDYSTVKVTNKCGTIEITEQKVKWT